MICPVCNNNTIPFFKQWLKGWFGVYECKKCNAKVKVKSNFLLSFFSYCLGVAAIVIGVYARSLIIFVLALALAAMLDTLMNQRFRKLIVAHDNSSPIHSRYLIEILAAIMLGALACMAKIVYASMYRNILFFNLLDVLVYGIMGFVIGYLSRWRAYFLTLIFIMPSVIFVGWILVRVYITKVANYPSYEWMASLILIPLISFLGVSLGKWLRLRGK